CHGHARRYRQRDGRGARGFPLRRTAWRIAHDGGVLAFPACDRGLAAARHRVVCAGRTHGFCLPTMAACAEAAAMTALLEVTGINKRCGGVHAVHNLSLTVADGEILGLIDPNGAGKSTVFNVINGVLIRVGSYSKGRTLPAKPLTASLAVVSPAPT